MLKKKVISLSVLLLIINIALQGYSSNLGGKEEEWLKNAQRIDKCGWIFLHIEGGPYERGFQRGYLTATEIKGFLNTLAYIEKFNTTNELDFFVKTAVKLFQDKIPEEYMEEMKGMVAGMEKKGEHITIEEILFLNGFIDIIDYWLPQQKANEPLRPGCSAFIATGNATETEKIVLAHNTWSYYPTIRFANIIIDILPDKGHRMLMQTWGSCIYSATDFFITGAGLVGAETTIFRFNGFDPEGVPVFVRARQAMQYANSIDEWVKIMKEKNNGAYACSWLLGDIRTNEIARIELGLKYHSFEKKKEGYFTGSNLVNDLNILRHETNSTCDDIRDFCVARRIRWDQLMSEFHGKLNAENARALLSDHFDIYLQKELPGTRSICGHFDRDNAMIPNGTQWPAYFPAGTIDGKIVDANMAKKWRFWAKWGSPCGIGFDAGEYLAKNPQYQWLKDYMVDIPSMPWTIFPLQR